MFSSAQLMGFAFAFSVVWPLLQVTGAVVGFVLAWVVASSYLLRKRYPSEVVGSGLYATAVGVLVTPVEVYLPTVAAGSERGGFEGATMVADGARDLAVWVVLCGLLAVSMIAVGRYFKRVADRREARAFKVRRWYEEQ